jgi:hypothetical protein
VVKSTTVPDNHLDKDAAKFSGCRHFAGCRVPVESGVFFALLTEAGNWPAEADDMTIKFFPNDKGNPPGKLADAELHFSGGPLDGLKLVGFAVWERKNGGRNVTVPARQYSVNGERRSFALLRPIMDASSQDRLRDVILDAYKEHEAALAEAS